MTDDEQANSLSPAPHAFQEGDLVMYLEGIAAPSSASGSPTSSPSAEELEAWYHVQSLLSGALYRRSCPNSEELLQYEAGLLLPSDSQRLEAHIGICSFCQQDIAELAAVADPVIVSPERKQSAESLLRPHLERAGRQLRALLQPMTPPLAFSLRGRQKHEWVYQAGDYQIILAVAPPVVAEDIRQLEGHIMDQGASAVIPHGAVVHLLRDGQPIVYDGVDEFGYFSLENVESGEYTVRIDLDPDTILIEGVTIE